MIKYVCSNGTEYELFNARMRVTSGTFHSYEWKKIASELKMGDDVRGFTKEAGTYDLTFSVRGDLEERREFLNELQNCFEYDVANVTPAKIWYGEYYIECFITALENGKSGTSSSRSECKVQIYCPFPMWISEEKRSFYKDSDKKGETYDFLDYNYDYDYDYSKQESGQENWEIEHFKSNHFKMIVYGKAVDPRIVINGHIYQVYTTLEENEYLTIESRDKTITKYLANGTTQNILGKRRREDGKSVFDEIPSGSLLITWNGEFGFDITVYKERSTPMYGPDTN